MKLVIKYQISAINSCWEKCDEKYLGWTEGQMEGRIEVKQYTLPPPLVERGYNNTNPTKKRGELRCSGRVSSSCSTSDTCRVNLVTNPVISHEWGKDWEVLGFFFVSVNVVQYFVILFFVGFMFHWSCFSLPSLWYLFYSSLLLIFNLCLRFKILRQL